MPTTSSTSRRVLERSALAAFAPVVALVPVWLLAIAVFWLPLWWWWQVPYLWFALAVLAAGVLLFTRPVQQLVLTRLLGARSPRPDEMDRLEPAWLEVAQANHLAPQHYLLAVLDDGDLNAFACGGHLVVVTSFAVEVLPHDELCGVLAHELSHHLGSHTIALTIAQWLSLPILLLARIGFFLQNVAVAATESFARGSSALTAIGRAIGAVLTAVSWVFLAGLLAAGMVGNLAGRGAEHQADRRAVEMGFGRELAAALRRVLDAGVGERPVTWLERVHATHPPARTRIARIEALTRASSRRGRRPPR